MANRDIIRLEQVRTDILSHEHSSQLIFSNIVYIPEYYSNLISLGQLQETSILYYNYLKCIILKQKRNTIRSTTRKKKFFVFNIQFLLGKVMLAKKRGKFTYLLSKNLQIKLQHQPLENASNTRVIETFKLVDRIDITIDNSQQKKHFLSNFKDNNKNKNLESSCNNPPTLMTILLNKITSTSSINYNNNIKQLYNFYIKNKHTKIVKHKKMTLTICRI